MQLPQQYKMTGSQSAPKYSDALQQHEPDGIQSDGTTILTMVKLSVMLVTNAIYRVEMCCTQAAY